MSTLISDGINEVWADSASCRSNCGLWGLCELQAVGQRSTDPSASLASFFTKKSIRNGEIIDIQARPVFSDAMEISVYEIAVQVDFNSGILVSDDLLWVMTGWIHSTYMPIYMMYWIGLGWKKKVVLLRSASTMTGNACHTASPLTSSRTNELMPLEKRCTAD
jgi:hypothetical protein